MDFSRKSIHATLRKANSRKSILGNAFDVIVSFIDIIKYRKFLNVSPAELLIIVGSITYFLTPFDAFPDFLPAGFIDDIAIMLSAAGSVIVLMRKYKTWKRYSAYKGKKLKKSSINMTDYCVPKSKGEKQW